MLLQTILSHFNSHTILLLIMKAQSLKFCFRQSIGELLWWVFVQQIVLCHVKWKITFDLYQHKNLSFCFNFKPLWAFITIIIKNFNRRNSHGHNSSKRCKLAQHAHSHGSNAFTHTFTSTELQTCAKRQLSYYRIWNQHFFERYLREAEWTGVHRENPDSLPANRYHILEEKIQRPGRELIRTLTH